MRFLNLVGSAMIIVLIAYMLVDIKMGRRKLGKRALVTRLSLIVVLFIVLLRT